ncbi:hypothetical protein V7S43_015148 [Phytophthora oleae]|uniref:Uncharacterized protein n=1 Tax=Phytophthora oleae TaxID=2107226 RepID=A0ABD3F2H6_9STRA
MAGDWCKLSAVRAGGAEELLWGAVRDDGAAFFQRVAVRLCVGLVSSAWMQSRRLQQRFALVCWDTLALLSCWFLAAFLDWAGCSSRGFRGASDAGSSLRIPPVSNLTGRQYVFALKKSL